MLHLAFTSRVLSSATLAALLLGASSAHAQDQPPPPPPAPPAARAEAEAAAEREVEGRAADVEAEAERAVESPGQPPTPPAAAPPATAPPPAAPEPPAPAAAPPAVAAPAPAAAPPAPAVAPVPIGAAPPTVAPAPGAPPAVAAAPDQGWDSRPYILPYEDGQPIPPGYRVDSTVRTGLVIPGSVIFGGMYFSSLMHSVLMQSDCEDSPCNVGDDALVAMMVPLGGPFAAAAMTDVDSFETAAYVSGMLQVAGLTMLIVGVSAQEKRLERVAERIELVPTPTGGMVRGTF